MSHPFRFGVVAARAGSGDEWIALVRRAEQLGYSTLLVPDRIGPLLSPLPALVVAAGATRTLRLGTFVLANGLRNPALLAREVATLDFLSGGRFELGIGTGVSENDFLQAGVPYGSPGSRVERLAATLSTLKALLTGQFAGSGGLTGGHHFPPVVQQPRPPILVAAGGQRALALAALAIRGSWPRLAQGGSRRRSAPLPSSTIAVPSWAPSSSQFARARRRARPASGVDSRSSVRPRSPFSPARRSSPLSLPAWSAGFSRAGWSVASSA